MSAPTPARSLTARDTLVRVLRDAQQAHHQYEVKLQSPDPLWPEWYADFILSTVTITPHKPEPVKFQCHSHLPFRDDEHDA